MQSCSLKSEYDALSDYDFEWAVVTSKTADLINTIMYPVAIALAVALIFVLRIQYKEYEVEGNKKQVTIYNAIGKKRENLLNILK